MTFAPDGYEGPRNAATAIYFLLHPGEQSRWHVVRSDELWFWHRFWHSGVRWRSGSAVAAQSLPTASPAKASRLA